MSLWNPTDERDARNGAMGGCQLFLLRFQIEHDNRQPSNDSDGVLCKNIDVTENRDEGSSRFILKFSNANQLPVAGFSYRQRI